MSTVGPLDAAKVAAHIADSERRIEVQSQVAEQLESLADDARREEYRLESQLAAFRALVAERGTGEATS